jgi:hypothetical protein
VTAIVLDNAQSRGISHRPQTARISLATVCSENIPKARSSTSLGEELDVKVRLV